MARIFTITEGVENMGALKSGGQGSVYKGKRNGEILTAIKILPTPIYSETGDDKNFVSFQNEVEKLKKVNEYPNPNVVTILSAGITDTGNFPYIEMEYIEGPDLAELLKPPHAPIFTLQEALRVAEHISNALAHCHGANVKHGDIKSNNVKFNIHTGNYILLDFGLSVMSDEERRSSLRQAGAVEFMAPEQHEGNLLFETEIYSFGVIMFELLSGTVPFPLTDHGESARNSVMVLHLESIPPNLLSLRQQHMPDWWSKEKKEHEMQVPEWLVSMVYKCLEKNPADRFANGSELHEHIVRNSMAATLNIGWGVERVTKLEQENEALRQQLEVLQQQKSTEDPKPHEFDGEGRANTKVGTKVINGKNIMLALLLVVVAWLIIDKNKTSKNNMAFMPATTMKPDSAVYTPSEEEELQLKKARTYLVNGRLEEARLIYKALAVQEIPEAMYEYGNLTLLNENDKGNCIESMAFLHRAARKGYVPAKRTLGFLYAYAADSISLKQKGYLGCSFNHDIPRGSKLLMEAALQGDTAAGILLDELNNKFAGTNE